MCARCGGRGHDAAAGGCRQVMTRQVLEYVQRRATDVILLNANNDQVPSPACAFLFQCAMELVRFER
jgi:hypothetical protein